MTSPKILKTASTAANYALHQAADAVVFHGDCMRLINEIPNESIPLAISSPPYSIGKDYENTEDIDSFLDLHKELLPQLVSKLQPGGSLCWQVGSHVKNGVVTPLDYLIMDCMRAMPEMKLRNRIVWTFGHGLHCSNRFSGRHETLLWFTKGDTYNFDLDAVRVKQKYPGKRYASGPKKGKLSGNPLGKNPGDVWDIPNVKARHVEKTTHPCQFPVGLVHRLVRALSKPGDLVFDPFCGVSSTGVAALALDRRFLGAEVMAEYIEIGRQRLKSALAGEAEFRPAEQEIFVPDPNSSVAREPDPMEWQEVVRIRTQPIQNQVGACA